MRSSGVMPPSPVVVDVPTSVAARPRASLARADERAEAHAGNGDGDIELEGVRPVAATEHRLRLTALPVALQRIAGDGCREEDEVVEGRELPAGAEPTDGVLARLGHVVDPRDDVGREAGVGRNALEGLVRPSVGAVVVRGEVVQLAGRGHLLSGGRAQCGRTRSPRPGA